MKTDLLKKLKSTGAPGKGKKKRNKKQDFYALVKGKKCFSFDFGEYATKLTVAKVSANNIQVLKQVTIENRDSVRTIQEDNLNDWRTKISAALSENKLNPSGQIGICAINSRHYISRQFEVPLMEEDDLAGYVAHEISQSLELDMDDHVFQHKILQTYEKNGRTMCIVWAAAISKSLCQNYYDLLTSLKLKPLLLDVHVNGLEGLLFADPNLAERSQNTSVAMIDYGLRNTEMYIFSKGHCLQTSNIDSGEGKLIAAARNALGEHIVDIQNNNKLTVPPQQIYEILRDAKTSETSAVFADVVQKWISEINNIVRRYNIDHPSTQIERVFLYGGSQQLPWLKAYLEKLIGIPVEVITTTSSLNLSDSAEEFARYLNSASVLLRRNDGTDCNFFENFTAAKRKADKIPIGRLVACAVVLLLACGLFYGYQAFRGFMMNKQLDYLAGLKTEETLNKKYAATLELSRVVDDIQKDENFMELLIDNVKYSNSANLPLLKIIDRCIGEDGTLRDIKVSQNSISMTITNKGDGEEEDVRKLTAIENRLRTTGHFSNVFVQTIEKSASENSLEMDCYLIIDGGAIHEE